MKIEYNYFKERVREAIATTPVCSDVVRIITGCYSTKTSFRQYVVNQHRVNPFILFSLHFCYVIYRIFLLLSSEKKTAYYFFFLLFDSILFLFSVVADSFFFLYVTIKKLSRNLFMYFTKKSVVC